MNNWRALKALHIENACLLLAGTDPWKVWPNDEVLPAVAAEPMGTDLIKAALRFEVEGAAVASRWFSIAKEAAIAGEIVAEGKIRVWAPDGLWSPGNPAELSMSDHFDFDVTRTELARWLLSLGWEEAELPGFLAGAAPSFQQSVPSDELRSLEAFGLLVELYASQHGPDYQHGPRPKASRIVKDMLAAVPDDVTTMGDRKLKEHVGAAIKAWEAKKRR